jgi:hypothetical protein
MPSQIAHQLFAEDVLREVLGESSYTANSRVIAFAAQGPDIFYHNQRTKPSAYFYGRRIHKKNYGKLILEMVSSSDTRSALKNEVVRAFILGFTTHALLDRETHPYIIYHAGWVEPFTRESRKFHRTHPFLERIIDVLLLEELRGVSLQEYDYSHQFNLEDVPEEIVEIVVEAIGKTYPKSKKTPISKESFRNAVRDALFFIHMTDPHREENKIEAFKREKRNESSSRILALFYPDTIPEEIDFLNNKKATWIDPCKPTEKRNDSFLNCYKRALSKAVPIAETINRVIDGNGESEEIERAVGNENLSDGRSTSGCTPSVSDPFPLNEMLNELYKKMEATVGHY